MTVIKFEPSLPCGIVDGMIMCGKPATAGYVLKLSPEYQPPPFRIAGLLSLQPVCERHAREMAKVERSK